MLKKDEPTEVEQKILDVLNPVLTTYTFVLDENGEPVPCEDILTWGRFMEMKDKRIVGRDIIQRIPEIMVSTIFLGMDHGWSSVADLNYKPVLWETMVFGLRDNEIQTRYTSLAEAKQGHKMICDGVRLLLQTGRAVPE